MQLHLSLGLLGWVGTLLMAVSWKVLPMFYLSEAVDPRHARAALLLVGIRLGGSVLALMARLVSLQLTLTPLAGAVVWVAHPLSTLRALSRRRRRRAHGSVWFWRAGMGFGLCAGPLAVASLWLDSPVWPLLFGWVAIWGWAGMVIYGLLCRIVPFLVWFHRLSRLIGVVDVPPMRRILADRWVRQALWVHLTSVVLGAGAILSGTDLAARVCGLGLVAVGLSLGASLVTALRLQVPA